LHGATAFSLHVGAKRFDAARRKHLGLLASIAQILNKLREMTTKSLTHPNRTD
jgi:hypothetical protein